MRDITLDDLTDSQLDSESRLLVSMIRSRYPKLDLRRGTVLRDLLIDTDASVGALFSAQADEQRLSSSLQALLEREEAGEIPDTRDVAAILSNFGMVARSGTRARGLVRISVSTRSDHVVGEGMVFTTIDGLRFVTTSGVYASMSPSSGQVQQHAAASTYWYLVPVEAEDVGSAGNLGQGTALTPDTSLSDFVSAEAYVAFSGGSDLEDLRSIADRIRPSLSVRALTNAMAIESRLRDEFDTTEHTISDVSVCGYGNPAQHRDKHNLFGVSVGGRVDIYVRNFTDLPVVAVTVSGKPVERADDGTATFVVHVGHDEVPGMAAVYSVSDPASNALSSYAHSETWSNSVEGVAHDLSPSDSREAYGTVWRSLDIKVSEVPISDEEWERSVSDGGRLFRVALVALPSAPDLQTFVDDGTVRNAGSDCVVRAPVIMNVSVNAMVRHKATVPFDVSKAETAICSYINSTGFCGRLTRSEISAILTGLGAASVDLRDEAAMLYGYAYDAYGAFRELSGDSLDLEAAADERAMFTRDTVVFVAEPKNVHVTAVVLG